MKRIPAGDIEKVVLEQLGAVFRTPTLVAKTYFAAREIEAGERGRLHLQKKELEQSFQNVRQEALKLMSADSDDPDRNSQLTLVNQQAARLTRHLGNVSARLKAIYPKPFRAWKPSGRICSRSSVTG